MTEHTSFINGEPGTAVSLTDRGFQYGHGVFETMRLCDRHLPLWRYHSQRLHAGARVLRIPLDIKLLDTYLARAIASFPPSGVVRLTVTAVSAERGYRCKDRATAQYVVQCFALPATDYRPMTLQPCRYRLPDNPALAGLKHLNRLDQVVAALELDQQAPDGVDGLLLDTHNNIVEALSSNLFVFSAGRWSTPGLARCGVAGVMRHYLMEMLEQLPGEPVAVVDMDTDSLRGAQELFICNSVRGICPVNKVIGVGEWPACGVETRRVQDQLARRLPCFAS